MAKLLPLCCAPPSSVYTVFATPDSASVAFRLTVTLVLFQFAGAVALVVGAVLSILTAGLLVAVVVLPALSDTEALAVRPLPSPLMVLSARTEPARPDSASDAVQWMVTLPWYQPAAFGAVVGAPLRVGATLSILMPLTVALALLSALSTAVPVTAWFAALLLSVVGPVQL